MNDRGQRIAETKKALRQHLCNKSVSETFRQLDAMHELREHQRRFKNTRKKESS